MLATVIFFLSVVPLVIFSVPRLCSVNCRRKNLKMEYWGIGGKTVIAEYQGTRRTRCAMYVNVNLCFA